MLLAVIGALASISFFGKPLLGVILIIRKATLMVPS
jgi:hypothetical protein